MNINTKIQTISQQQTDLITWIRNHICQRGLPMSFEKLSKTLQRVPHGKQFDKMMLSLIFEKGLVNVIFKSSLREPFHV